jgi:hypothetical protein
MSAAVFSRVSAACLPCEVLWLARFLGAAEILTEHLAVTSIEETSVDPRAGERGSTAISGHVAVRHHREGGLSTTADSLRRLDPGARGPHTSAGASARENIRAERHPSFGVSCDTTSTSVADPPLPTYPPTLHSCVSVSSLTRGSSPSARGMNPTPSTTTPSSRRSNGEKATRNICTARHRHQPPRHRPRRSLSPSGCRATPATG